MKPWIILIRVNASLFESLSTNTNLKCEPELMTLCDVTSLITKNVHDTSATKKISKIAATVTFKNTKISLGTFWTSVTRPVHVIVQVFNEIDRFIIPRPLIGCGLKCDKFPFGRNTHRFFKFLTMAMSDNNEVTFYPYEHRIRTRYCRAARGIWTV